MYIGHIYEYELISYICFNSNKTEWISDILPLVFSLHEVKTGVCPKSSPLGGCVFPDNIRMTKEQQGNVSIYWLLIKG